MPATLTSDLDHARADLAEHGHCLIEGALPPERLAEVRDTLERVAAAEIEAGTDYVYEGGCNQRVWTLLNKGQCFIDLALDPTVGGIMTHLLGHGFLLSNLDANIAGPGGQPMFLHADQSFMTPPWPYPAVALAMWMLDDFTADNGATRIVPGSHLMGHGPDYSSRQETVPVTGPAGTLLVFEGRLWHQTGANTTATEKRHGVLAYYCRPFMRTQENWFLSLDPSVLEQASPELRALLGYEMYLSLGMVDGMPLTGPRF